MSPKPRRHRSSSKNYPPRWWRNHARKKAVQASEGLCVSCGKLICPYWEACIVTGNWKKNEQLVRYIQDNCSHPNCKLQLRDSCKVELHHITPLGEGGENVGSNVKVLCQDCHRQIHKRNLVVTKLVGNRGR